MRIFLGTEEIASVLMGLAEGFQDLGHSTTTYVSQKNKYYNVSYDIEKGTPLNNLIQYKNRNYPSLFKFLCRKIDARITPAWLGLQTDRLIKDHDLFVFVWRPWLPAWKIFPKIKKAGKRIVCIHLGSDVRDASAYQQEFGVNTSLWDVKYHDDLNDKMKRVRYHEIFADAIFSVPDQAGLYIRPYKRIYIPLSSKKNIAYHVPGREIPLIIHAPTNSSIKGTKAILSALAKLEAEGLQFQLKVLEGLPNPQLMQELTNADIVIDQVDLHGPGVFGVEAMAAGCAVATKTISPDNYDPPVCSINEQNMPDKLRFLIKNREYRTELARKGYAFSKAHNNPGITAEIILNTLSENQPDYYPHFYINQYKLPPNNALTDENLHLSKQVLFRTNHLSESGIRNAVDRGLVASLTEKEYLQFRASSYAQVS